MNGRTHEIGVSEKEAQEERLVRAPNQLYLGWKANSIPLRSRSAGDFDLHWISSCTSKRFQPIESVSYDWISNYESWPACIESNLRIGVPELFIIETQIGSYWCRVADGLELVPQPVSASDKSILTNGSILAAGPCVQFAASGSLLWFIEERGTSDSFSASRTYVSVAESGG